MPDSLSQISRRGTRPSCASSSHIPSSRSSVRPVGIILARMNRECAAGDHQHRQQRLRAVLERDPHGREPQVALRRITRQPRQPVRRVDRPMLQTQPPDVVPEPRDRPRPTDPLGDHRGRHVRRRREQPPHQRLERRRTTSAPPAARTSAADPRPTPARPSTCRSPDPARPAAATHRPRPAAGSKPNPPLRSPIQSVWVASFSIVAMASFSSVVDKDTSPYRSHRSVSLIGTRSKPTSTTRRGVQVIL